MKAAAGAGAAAILEFTPLPRLAPVATTHAAKLLKAEQARIDAETLSMAFTRPRGWGVGVPLQVLRQHDVLEQLLTILQPDWWYDWSAFLQGDAADVGYIPMLWDGTDAQPPAEASFEQVIRDHPYRIWQFMNEANRANQANKTPAQAFAGLTSYLQAAWRADVPSQYAAPGIEMSEEGLAWATEFFKLCRQRSLHRAPAYITVHSYIRPRYPQDRAHWVEMWDRFWRFWEVWTPDIEVVVTETCAVNYELDDQKRVMDLARETLDTDQRVVGMAWYSAITWSGDIFPNAALTALDGDGVSLTDLGRYWRQLAA